MAKQVTLVDDVDGSNKDVQPRTFQAHGSEYAIDLGPTTWDELRQAQKVVEHFIEHATIIETKTARRRNNTALSRLSPDDKKAIRAALGKGPRGTIPDSEVENWLQAKADPVAEAVAEPVAETEQPATRGRGKSTAA